MQVYRPARGLKLGPKRLKGPNFAKPAHLAQARRGWGLGAGRSGRSAAGGRGPLVGVFGITLFRVKEIPRLISDGGSRQPSLPHESICV